MSWLRLSSLSVGSLTTTILLGVITGYLLSLKNKTVDSRYLAGYIATLFVLLLSYTFRYSVFSPAAMASGQISNLIVFGVVCFVQFAYHIAGNLQPRESRIALCVQLAASLLAWGSLFFAPHLRAVYDFRAQYFTYEFGPRIGMVTLAGYVWTVVVLARKTVILSRRASTTAGHESVAGHLLRPSGRAARSTGSFALLALATMLIAILYLLFQVGAISRAAYSLVFNTGSLLICLMIFSVYVNNATQPTSFRLKIVGIPLAAVLVSFGILSSALMPVLHATLAGGYRSEVERVRSALSSGDFSALSPEVAYVVPDVYVAPDTPPEVLPEAASTQGQEGLLPGDGDPAPRFFYDALGNPSSFFFFYPLEHQGRQYRVGFYYPAYLLSIHRFAAKMAVLVLVTAALVMIVFPLVFEWSLFRPLRDLQEAVWQVETGNYAYEVRVGGADEIGRLAHGYNRMVRALKNSEGNFKALAENANDAILIFSDEGKIIFANSRAAELSGYGIAQLRRKHFREFLHPEERAAIEERFTARMAGREAPHCYESRIIDRERRELPVEITGAVTFWHDQPADVVIIRDISERKRAEELLRSQQELLLRADKLAALGALVSGVAHEINNPNQVVTLNTRFLADGLARLFSMIESGEAPEGEVRIQGLSYQEFRRAAVTALEELSASTARIDHIVSELKGFVRGGEPGLRAPTDVNQVVRSITDLSRHFIRKATDHFELRLEAGLPAITIDRVHLEQVLLNLLQNACQSLPDRRKGVSIATRHDEASGVIRIEVGDEGIGIPEENLPRLTDPFFTTRRSQGGTGLGLSVSSRIVEEYHGSMSFRSRVGQGTVVTVCLPVD
jgi:PAS domain S-box-containing protein